MKYCQNFYLVYEIFKEKEIFEIERRIFGLGTDLL